MVVVSFIGEGNRIIRRKHRPIASHWQIYHIVLYRVHHTMNVF